MRNYKLQISIPSAVTLRVALPNSKFQTRAKNGNEPDHIKSLGWWWSPDFRVGIEGLGFDEAWFKRGGAEVAEDRGEGIKKTSIIASRRKGTFGMRIAV